MRVQNGTTLETRLTVSKDWYFQWRQLFSPPGIEVCILWTVLTVWQVDSLTVSYKITIISTGWQFLIRLQSYLPCDPIIHRVTTQEKWKLVSNKGLYTYSSLTIAPNWKQPKLPSADEWIIKLWQIHTMKTLQQYKATTVMNLKSIMLPERKQATHCMILLIGHME